MNIKHLVLAVVVAVILLGGFIGVSKIDTHMLRSDRWSTIPSKDILK